MEKKANGLSLLGVIAMCMILMVHFGSSLSLPSVLYTLIAWCQYGATGFSLASTVVLTWVLHNIIEIPFGKKEKV